MRRLRKFSRILYCIVFLGFCFFALLKQAAAGGCKCDITPPDITITSPTADESYITDETIIDLAGEVSDEIGVKQVTWSNKRGGSGTAVGATNWIDPWYWEIIDISLLEGDNQITVKTMDAAGNEAESTLLVTYNPPPPPPPPSSVKEIDNKKAKFTFYFGGPDYDGIDRSSIVAHLLKEPDEEFVMPSEMDVTVTVRVPDPYDPSIDLQIFTQTIPAGTVSRTRKYRYTSGPPGIRELQFQERNSTSIYMYVFVEKVDFLPDLRASMTPEEYLEFVRSISNYKVTVQIEDNAWSGDGTFYSETFPHKVELRHNR
jgi:hypothetical protein